VLGGIDDGRSDVFSLGEVLYQMICGTMPWLSKHQIRMACGMAPKLPPPAISISRRTVPAELEKLVERSLAWELNDRPTAQQFAAELNRLIPSLDDGLANMVPPERSMEVELFNGAPTARSPYPAAIQP